MILGKLKEASEVLLISQCRIGNERARYQIYKLYVKAMYNIATRMSGNKADADDIIQDAFIKAFTEIGKLKNDDAFGGWLKRIVINKCLDLKKKRKHLFIEERIDKQAVGEIPEEEFDSTVRERLVHKTIKKLPDGAREILVLRALEGYRHAEIAEMLGITESTSKTQFFRAKQLFVKWVKKELNERESRKIFKEEQAKP